MTSLQILDTMFVSQMTCDRLTIFTIITQIISKQHLFFFGVGGVSKSLHIINK